MSVGISWLDYPEHKRPGYQKPPMKTLKQLIDEHALTVCEVFTIDENEYEKHWPNMDFSWLSSEEMPAFGDGDTLEIGDAHGS